MLGWRKRACSFQLIRVNPLIKFTYHLFRITVFTGAVILFLSCENSTDEAKNLFRQKKRPVPTGQTYNFEAYYTLKGKIAMLLQAPLMEDYTGNEFPRQIFPKGAYMEIYNKSREKTTVRADKAVIYNKTGLTELIGNVVITGSDGSTLKTSRLFWDRTHDHLFTDEKIEFQRQDEYIHGKGFDSNMSFTTARVNDVEGIIRIKTKS